MGGAEQFLRRRAGRALEARLERVGPLKGSAAERDGALAALEVPFPVRFCSLAHLFTSGRSKVYPAHSRHGPPGVRAEARRANASSRSDHTSAAGSPSARAAKACSPIPCE